MLGPSRWQRRGVLCPDCMRCLWAYECHGISPAAGYGYSTAGCNWLRRKCNLRGLLFVEFEPPENALWCEGVGRYPRGGVKW